MQVQAWAVFSQQSTAGQPKEAGSLLRGREISLEFVAGFGEGDVLQCKNLIMYLHSKERNTSNRQNRSELTTVHYHGAEVLFSGFAGKTTLSPMYCSQTMLEPCGATLLSI